jgi:HEAT repeat protein
MMRHFAVWLAALFLCSALQAQDAAQSAGERRRTVQTLVRQGPQAIPKVAQFVTDPDLNVRIEAVKGLVDLDTGASLDPLIQATSDNDPEIQIRATDGLVNFYLPGFADTGLAASIRRAGNKITVRLLGSNEQVIEPFVEVRPEVVAALARLVRGGSSMESRANAARAAGVLRGRAALPELLEAVHSKDSPLIYECLIALQKIRDESAGPGISFLLRDMDERVQVAAIETKGLLRNNDALPDLRGVLTRTESRVVRRAALSAIAMLPNPASRELLSRYLSDRDAATRGAAAEGLGRLKDPADLPALQKAFDDEGNASARVSLAFALVMQGKLDATGMSPFEYLLNSLNSSVHAGEAKPLLIEAARDARVRQALTQPLKSGTKDEKIGLLQVLGSSGDRESVPLMEPLTRDSNVDVASEAVRALRTLKARLP